MFESTTRLDDCTLEQLAADERADALRCEADAAERALFLSEATAAARREPSTAEIRADERRHQLEEHVVTLCTAINRHIPLCTGEWDDAMKAAIRLANELGINAALAVLGTPALRLPLIPGDNRPAA